MRQIGQPPLAVFAIKNVKEQDFFLQWANLRTTQMIFTVSLISQLKQVLLPLCIKGNWQDCKCLANAHLVESFWCFSQNAKKRYIGK